MAVGWQIVLRMDDSRVLAPGIAERRALARAVIRVAEPRGLLAFGAADTHLHVVLLGQREHAGRTAQALSVALSSALLHEARFEPARITPIRDQFHLENAFHYAMTQGRHHGVTNDPHLEATSVPDALGLRVLAPRLVPRIREHLPRVRRARIVAHLAVSRLERAESIEFVADAAAAAIGRTDLKSKDPLTVAARVAAVHVARGAGATRVAGIPPRTASRLAAEKADTRLVQAIRWQIGLWAEVARRDEGGLSSSESDEPSSRPIVPGCAGTR